MNPNTCIRNTAPISETGIATSGTSTDRSEPRNRKMTMATMTSVTTSVLDHLVDGVVNVFCGVVRDAAGEAGGHLLFDGFHFGAHALDHVQRVGVGQRPRCP